MKWHPDRILNETLKAAAEEKFVEIAKAYKVYIISIHHQDSQMMKLGKITRNGGILMGSNHTRLVSVFQPGLSIIALHLLFS